MINSSYSVLVVLKVKKILVFAHNSLGGKERRFVGSKLAALECFIIFNIAAVIGFVMGTAAFVSSNLIVASATFAWLFGNVVGGLSHFSANYVLQRKKKDRFVKNFVVFNATGIVGFLVASLMFAVAIFGFKDANVAWLCGSVVGTLSHFILNDKAMKLQLKRISDDHTSGI